MIIEEKEKPAGAQQAPDPPQASTEQAPVPEPPHHPPRRNNWKPLALTASGLLAIMIVGVMLWKFLPYAPFVLPSAVALGHILLKDWKNYNPAWKRWPILVTVMAAAVFGVAYQTHQLQEKAAAEDRAKKNEARAQADIDALTRQVSDGVALQKSMATAFASQFSSLSRELGELKTKVVTEALQEQIGALEAQLENTRKVLDPPRAALLFTFAPYDPPPLGQPLNLINETTLPVQSDGSVHFEFNILNLTDAAALDGELNLQICDQCKFAKEPPDFKRLQGQNERIRFMQLPRLLPNVILRTLSADVIPPGHINRFSIRVIYRCRTCVLHKEGLMGTINIDRQRSKN